MEVLGFEIPETEEQFELYDKAFEGFPYELDMSSLDFEKIWENRDDIGLKVINNIDPPKTGRTFIDAHFDFQIEDPNNELMVPADFNTKVYSESDLIKQLEDPKSP